MTWRELPTWLAVILAIFGIYLTYWETRTANEREVVFRVWDDTRELYRYAVDFSGNSSRHQVDLEYRLLGNINSHVGLLADRPLSNAGVAVSRAWAQAHMRATKDRDKLSCEIGKMLDLMENQLGTYRPISLPEFDPPSCRIPGNANGN